MKLSVNWLREFVDLSGISAEEIAEKLTLHTCEVEEVVEKSANFKKIFAGKLISTRKHKDSDKLTVGTFDLGAQGKKQIIFGQVFPLNEGEIYLVALDGAKLASGIEIKNSEIRGEKSEGMVCTNQELGMKNDGFIRLNDDKLVGKPATEIFAGFADQIIDVDNKSLTHRPDLMGHRGIARELSAIFGKKTLDKFNLETENSAKNANKHLDSSAQVKVDIQTENCRRFCSARMSGIKVAPSKYETQILLENLETRAISNIVDITNLNLLGLGQPMHVFDAEKIRGKIIVRQAKNGEKIVALDEEEYELTSDDIVIADEEKVLSIAGIMGGLESAVTEKTTEIIFESANFCPTSVRKTSQRLGLRSESSMRYEKSLDAEQCLPALLAAIKMVSEICPNAKLETGITDEYPIQNPTKKIKLDPEYVRNLSGLDLDDAKIRENLESLGFKVIENWEVVIPSWRATKDIEIAEDLIEEIVRLYGFANIKATLPILPITPPRKNELRKQDWKIRGFLASKGMMEVYHSSFVGPQDPEFTENFAEYVQIDNPSNDECKFLRQTLISNFVRHLKPELRAHGEVNFFELGKTYHAPTNEIAKLALFSAKLKGDTEKMFYEMKANLVELCEFLGIEKRDLDFRPAEKLEAFCHPYRCAEIFAGNEKIGYISVIHPVKNSVKNSTIVFAEVETEKLQKFAEISQKKYQKMSNFPAVHRDISILVDKKVLVGDLVKISRENSEFLTDIELFDDFVDEEKFGKDLKNLAFHLTFKSREKTLEENEIEQNFNNILEAWAKKFGAKLRLEFDQENNKI